MLLLSYGNKGDELRGKSYRIFYNLTLVTSPAPPRGGKTDRTSQLLFFEYESIESFRDFSYF